MKVGVGGGGRTLLAAKLATEAAKKQRRRPVSVMERLKKGLPTTTDYATPGAEPIAIEGTDLMTFLRRDAAKSLNGDGRGSLFDRNSRTRVFSGSILKVTYETCKTSRSKQSFVGALIAYRRSLPDTTFLLRNKVAGVGVEMMFTLFSPMIKKIEVLKRAEPGRCKLYHLRDKPQILLAGLQEAVFKHGAKSNHK